MKKLFILFLLLAFANNFIPAEKTINSTEIHIVRPGETLWSIAKNNKPENMDIREYIDRLEKYNKITADIKVDQEIEILKF